MHINTVQINLLVVLADNDEVTDQVCNVALNNHTSLNQLHQEIEEILLQRIKSLTKKEPVYRNFSTGDECHIQADLSKD